MEDEKYKKAKESMFHKRRVLHVFNVFLSSLLVN